jgi:hypothetical protein
MAGQPKKKQIQEMLNNIGIEAICDRIQCGESQAEIARSLDIYPAQLCRWISDDEQRTARAKIARHMSAESWMDRGLSTLGEIPDDGSTAQIARAREIAQHCRKMAQIRNPREYGDKLELAGDPDRPLSINVVKFGG